MLALSVLKLTCYRSIVTIGELLIGIKRDKLYLVKYTGVSAGWITYKEVNFIKQFDLSAVINQSFSKYYWGSIEESGISISYLYNGLES
jgi:hypothetical protein